MLADMLYLCDTHGCKSRVDLSFINDLRDPNKALKDRGWTTTDDDPPLNYCPPCSEKRARDQE